MVIEWESNLRVERYILVLFLWLGICYLVGYLSIIVLGFKFFKFDDWIV